MVASGVLGFASIALADHAWTNSLGEPYHWARTTPSFTLKLGDNVSNAWDSYLNTSITDWSASSVLDLVKVAGGTNNAKGSRTPKQCQPSSGRVEVCNAKYGANGWLGVASIWASGTHITAGTVKMNDTYFNTASYNSPAWKNLVMCQEIGHTFGLDHQDEGFSNANLGTCMDYTNSPASNQHPNAHDYTMLEEIYAHLDSSTTLSQTTTSLPQETDEWGREVRRSKDGRASLFVQDAGNGNKVLRHVFWAEPRGNHHEQ